MISKALAYKIATVAVPTALACGGSFWIGRTSVKPIPAPVQVQASTSIASKDVTTRSGNAATTSSDVSRATVECVRVTRVETKPDGTRVEVITDTTHATGGTTSTDTANRQTASTSTRETAAKVETIVKTITQPMPSRLSIFGDVGVLTMGSRTNLIPGMPAWMEVGAGVRYRLTDHFSVEGRVGGDLSIVGRLVVSF